MEMRQDTIPHFSMKLRFESQHMELCGHVNTTDLSVKTPTCSGFGCNHKKCGQCKDLKDCDIEDAFWGLVLPPNSGHTRWFCVG